jgi:hypothetical protein
LGNVNPGNRLVVADKIQHDRPIGRAETLNLGGLEMLEINLAHYGFFRSDFTRALDPRNEHLPCDNETSSQVHLEFIGAGQDPDSGPKTDASSTSLFVGRFGNAGNGVITGPGLISIDAGAFKDFAIRESLKFRIQTQIRNFPNHANLGVPEGNLNSGNYGRITSLNGSTTARIVVVGARFIF